MIGLFYGSTTGVTEAVAQAIKASFVELHAIEVECFDIAEFYLDEMLDFDYIIAGIPTWNVGQLQKDWEEVLEELDDLDLSGKYAAVFGLGDQIGYPDTYGDAVFFVAERLRAAGARLVGRWPVIGYEFNQSWALQENQFLGLMLDEDNQPEMTNLRIQAWVDQLAREFGLDTESTASRQQSDTSTSVPGTSAPGTSAPGTSTPGEADHD